MPALRRPARSPRLPFALPLAFLMTVALLACQDEDATLTPTPAPTDPTAEETLAIVAERTADLFGHPDGPGPAVTLLDDEQLAEVIDDLLADPEIAAALERDQAFYAILDLVPPGTDIAQLNRELLLTGLAGLYRPELDHLYVRMFGGFSALEESTASHEYTHYLQDLHYDLDRLFDAAAGNRDAELAVRALVEGDAVYVQNAYIAAHFNALQLFGMSFGGLLAASEAPAVPLAFTRETTFVYLRGERWVDELLWRGYSREQLYADPPRTTEEVLHPALYTADLPAPTVSLTIDPAGYPAAWIPAPPETIGELMLSIWLEEHRAGSPASAAAAGWNGDALRIFLADGQSVAAVARIAWDTAPDAEEFIDVAATALDRDGRYATLRCDSCPIDAWDGPAGVLLLGNVDPTTTDVVLVIAPTLAEAEQLLLAIR